MIQLKNSTFFSCGSLDKYGRPSGDDIGSQRGSVLLPRLAATSSGELLETCDLAMMTFRIQHRTRYAYDRPVTFGVHHLMMRPRDGHDLRILDSSLAITPRADVRWAYDTFGNSVAWLTFHDAADELVIESALELRRYGFDEPLPRIEPHAAAYPFSYDADDSIDLAPLLPLHYPADRPAVEAWIGGVVASPPQSTLLLLELLGSAIHRTFQYRRRVTSGVQSPAETIGKASGTCRDFALLFMEAARLLGFAARFVTGYLYDSSTDPGRRADDDAAVSGGGSTHAWADVFIPGAGWVEFDPTNRIVAGRNLIRVANTRSPGQAVPASGTYRHDGAAFLGMEVRVRVSRVD